MKPLLLDTNVLIKFLRGDKKICAITKGAVVYSLDTHFANVPLIERVVG